MTPVILGLGSNMGNRALNLEKALEVLSGAFIIRRVSSVYSTKSMLRDGQPDYYNIACSCLTELSPTEALAFVQNAEKELGRVKNTGRWGARVIDVDILDYGGLAIKTDVLEIPHPGMAFRSFVLYPLKDVEPCYKHPVTGLSAAEMIENLGDALEIASVGKLSFGAV